MIKKGGINLDPPYQREAGIWSDEKKQLFIDSIVNGYDVPKLYFHDIQHERGSMSYTVIDGKQRLGAIFDFLAGTFALAEDFTFSGDKRFLGEKSQPKRSQPFSALDESAREYVRSQQIDVVEVSDAEEDDIEELFSRLNNGEPLNAAEKRNAKGGDMIKLVRELAADPKLTSLLRFNDKRMAYHEVATKLIRLELSERDGQGIFCDLKKRYLDSMIDNNRRRSEGEITGLRTRLSKNISELTKVFGSNHPLMGKQSYPQLYYGWVKVVKNDYGNSNLTDIIRKFLESFHERRISNLLLPEDSRDATLVEFGRLMQQGTNDLTSMNDRAHILTRYLLQSHPELVVRDSRRAFNDNERYAIWVRSGKQCQGAGCSKSLEDIGDMHADHVEAWSRGGATALQNAQALCGDCNVRKGSR